MQASRKDFLKLAGAATGAAALGSVPGLSRIDALAASSKVNITFWCTPFVSGEDPKSFVDWFHTQQSTLGGIAFSTDYGPGDYSVQQHKFLIQAQTGTPDILEGLLENMVAYIKAGAISPITDRFNAWSEHMDFLPSTVKGLMFNGQLYGVPYNTNARVLLYRKSILKKHGLKVPTTWDELLSAGETISAKETGMSGFMCCTNRASVRGPQEWISWFFQVNQHMFKQNASGKWVLNATAEQFAKVFQLYYNLFYGSAKPAAATSSLGIDYAVLDSGYGDGKWAMAPEGPWMYAQKLRGAAQAAVIADTGIAPLPTAPGGSHGTYLEIKPILLNKYAAKPDAAFQAIQYLTSNKIMSEWAYVSGFIPPRIDVEKSARFASNWWQKGFTEILPTGVYLDPLNWAPVFDAIFATLQTVIYKKSTPAQAGAALVSQVNQLVSAGRI